MLHHNKGLSIMTKKLYFILIITSVFLFFSHYSDSVNTYNIDKEYTVNIELVSSPNGLRTSQYAAGPTGCYEIIRWTSGDGNILYTDLDTAQRIFLNSDLISDNNSSNDNSYINSLSQGNSIISTSNYIYIIGRGSANETYKEDYTKTYIQQRSLTGQIINEYTFPSNMILNTASAIAYDGTNLYFIAYTFKYEDGKATHMKCSLFMLNEENFHLSEAYIFNSVDNANIVSSYKNNLVLKTVKQIDISNYSYELQTLSLPEFKLTKKLDYSPKDSINCIKHNIYILDSTGNLKIYNCRDNSITGIDKLKKMSFDNCYFVAEPIDEYLFIYANENDTGIGKRFIFNTVDQELTEINLYNGDMFVGPYCSIKDYFLVITGEKLVNFWDIAPDKKTKFLSERIDYDYAWILKDDYLNNRPNFIPIENLIEYR